MNSYFFAYSGRCSPSAARTVLDNEDLVDDWAQPFPHGALLLSSLELRPLSEAIHERLGEAWFLLSRLDAEGADGWLPNHLWQHLRPLRAEPHGEIQTPSYRDAARHALDEKLASLGEEASHVEAEAATDRPYTDPADAKVTLAHRDDLDPARRTRGTKD